jgi:hypothetical protein
VGSGKALTAALHVWLPDVDAAYARALAAGAESQSAPEDKPYGDRTAGVVDRNGITWWISSPSDNFCPLYGMGESQTPRETPSYTEANFCNRDDCRFEVPIRLLKRSGSGDSVVYRARRSADSGTQSCMAGA